MKQTAMLILSCQCIIFIWNFDQTESYVRKQHCNKQQSGWQMNRMQTYGKADQSATIAIIEKLSCSTFYHLIWNINTPDDNYIRICCDPSIITIKYSLIHYQKIHVHCHCFVDCYKRSISR